MITCFLEYLIRLVRKSEYRMTGSNLKIHVSGAVTKESYNVVSCLTSSPKYTVWFEGTFESVLVQTRNSGWNCCAERKRARSRFISWFVYVKLKISFDSTLYSMSKRFC